MGECACTLAVFLSPEQSSQPTILSPRNHTCTHKRLRARSKAPNSLYDTSCRTLGTIRVEQEADTARHRSHGMHVRTERHADRSKGHRLSAGYALQVLSKDVYVQRVRLARWGDAQAHHCKVLHISAVVPLFPFHLKHIVWYTHSVVAKGAHTGRSRATCREPAYAGDHSRVGGTGIGT